MPSTLSTTAQADVRRVLDAAARRLLDAALTDPTNATSPAANPDSLQISGRRSGHGTA
jgi:hypothetical protein